MNYGRVLSRILKAKFSTCLILLTIVVLCEGCSSTRHFRVDPNHYREGDEQFRDANDRARSVKERVTVGSNGEILPVSVDDHWDEQLHPKAYRKWSVKSDFYIHVLEWRDFLNLLMVNLEYDCDHARNVRGVYVWDRNEGTEHIYVMYDEWGAKSSDGMWLPDLETIGHEIWHLRELGGSWHGKADFHRNRKIYNFKNAEVRVVCR